MSSWFDKLTTSAALCSLLALLIAASLSAQTTGTHPVSGRRSAPVMGYQAAAWLERPERVQEEEPDLAISILKIAKGASVADIGAGSGYWTVKLSERVGPSGKVFATDVQPQMLDLLG